MASTSGKTLAKVSLTQRNITTNENGVIGSRPALSDHWITSRSFTRYYPLPIVAGKLEESSLQEWLAEAEWYKKDLIWLLRLEHNRKRYVFPRIERRIERAITHQNRRPLVPQSPEDLAISLVKYMSGRVSKFERTIESEGKQHERMMGQGPVE